MKKPTPAELFLQQRLKDLRAASACTQAEASEQAGLSEIYYQAIKAGRRRNVSLEMMEKIAASYAACALSLSLTFNGKLRDFVCGSLSGRKVPAASCRRASPPRVDIHPRALHHR